MPTPVGLFLVNDVLPEGYRVHGPITNKGLHDLVVGLAKTDPAAYVRTIMALKNRGDEIATLEGVTVGLKDIEPLYEARDKIVHPAIEAAQREKDPIKREKIIVEAQKSLLEHTKKHPGSMTQMALSGARGNAAQLMKIVATPLAATSKKGIDPFLIRHSYSEGLTPAEYWTAAPEARANNVATVVSVSQPGEMAKILVANMINKVVSSSDCGTNNGIMMLVDDGHLVDRYAQAGHGLSRNTLITPQAVQALKSRGVKELLVRSPMTCSARQGVCQHCQGLNEKGQLHDIGTAVGVRAAQSMSEPLTQMALGSKHAVLTIKERRLEPQGLKGVRQLMEIPKAFQHEAVLAPHDGTVDKVETAPQGGHYIHVGKSKLYAGPDLTITSPLGTVVENGDALTDGVPHPAKVVAAKGIGAGRQYFVDALHRVYKNEGVNLDRRHLELLARSEMNHVRLLEADPAHPEFLKGDIIDYNNFRDHYQKAATRESVDDAVGFHLGQEVLHHTVGTMITPKLAKDLKMRGIQEVFVRKHMPDVEFIMKPIAMNPLLDPDWMGRLAHRYLKGSIQQAAHGGETSDIHGAHPVPAYVYGAELRSGPSGTY
jgi:DNA-directed RNA polymerase subunit beta'